MKKILQKELPANGFGKILKLAGMGLLFLAFAAQVPDGHAQGAAAYALSFDGVSNAVRIGAAPLPPPWTAEFWVNRQDAFDNSAILIGDVFTALKLEQFANTRQVGFSQFGVSDYFFNYIAPTGAWVHLAFVATTNTQLYVNGALQDTNSATISLPLGQLGGDIANRYNNHLRGVLDEVRIWNVARRQSDIQAAMNCPLTAPQPGLFAYWRFDEGSGVMASDSSGNGYSGTLVNGPSWVPSSTPINYVPVILQNPSSTTLLECRSASFSLVACGAPPLSYQWFFGSGPIDPSANPTATNATLQIPGAQFSDGGNYYCQISNPFGKINSTNVLLTLTPDPNPPKLLFAVGKPDLHTIVASFSSPIDDPANDSITGWAVSLDGTDVLFVYNAVRQNDTNLVLTTDVRDTNLIYALVLNNVRDACGLKSIAIDSSMVVSPQVTIQNGLSDYNGTQDTEISEAAPATPQGTNISFMVSDGSSRHQGLVRFDGILGASPGMIPSKSRIASAALMLGARQGPGGNGPLEIHRLLRDWNQNSNTWNNSFGGDGIQTNGVEAETSGILVNQTNYSKLAVDVTRSVQQWANGSSNYGWAILPAGPLGLATFYSSENPSQSDRPRLDVVYFPFTTNFIIAQPQSQVAVVGASATFEVLAVGCVPPTYQWLFNGTFIGGATNSTYTIPQVQFTNTGSYRVVIRGVGGANTSAIATLTVLFPPNTWQNAGGGKWEDAASWSGGLPNTSTVAMVITNAGSKTVTIDLATINSIPPSLSIRNLTIDGPSGTVNKLAITNAPLHVTDSIRIGANGQMVLNQSALVVDGIVYNDGAITLLGGSNQVGQLLLTNLSSTFTFTSGALVARNVIVANGQPLVVGNGAILRLTGGVSTFENGLVISPGATLAGCGVVVGAVTNQGAILGDCPGVKLVFPGTVTTCDHGCIQIANGGGIQ